MKYGTPFLFRYFRFWRKFQIFREFARKQGVIIEE
jgi:hypothetical protein